MPVWHGIFAKPLQPEYTQEARAAGLQGSVVLYVVVTRSGEVLDARVIQSLGLGLDEKAVEAVKKVGFMRSPTPGVETIIQSAEVPFALDPPVLWRIHRFGALLVLSKAEGKDETEKPVLREYVSPAGGCPADGADVMVKFTISKNGTPEKVDSAGKSFPPVPDAVRAAISNWKFQPGTYKRKAREAEAMVELQCGSPLAGLGEREVSRVGGGVSAPALVYKVEPEYTEEARSAKLQGTSTLSLTVDTSGHAVDIVVLRPLGHGLDEKAMEAVNRWRFRPGMKDGKPVEIQAQIEVNFRLLDN